jgi:hypothetical protein
MGPYPSWIISTWSKWLVFTIFIQIDMVSAL